MTGSLDRVRVVDLTTSVAGPFATQILGDLGADVVKVERPPDGDNTRGWGPPFWGPDSATFQGLNRNKRSILLDLADPDDRDVLTDLVRHADVLVQNLRPGVLDKHGFGYERARRLNPRLIYCEISGYGPVGPLSDRPAFDPLLQAFGGIMSLTGEEGGPPARVPASLLDQGSAMWAVIGVLDALRRRDQTGQGALVQTSLLQTALMWLPAQFTGYFAEGVVPARLGSGTVGIAPYEAFPTADGWVIIGAGNENLWRRLCGAIDRLDLLDDPRFTLNSDRVEHREALHAALSRTLETRDSGHWTEVLSDHGVPVTLIQTIDQVAEHEQVAAIGAIASVPHPRIANFRLVNTPIQVDGEHYAIRRVPPRLDGDADEIREDLRARQPSRAYDGATETADPPIASDGGSHGA
jgi:crotonobetainyl-CoA:carnitine CoA-transferase CaiB-like acyl-CoA transferase